MKAIVNRVSKTYRNAMVAMLVSITASPAFAATGSVPGSAGAMPWDGPLENLIAIMSGPLAKMAILGAIVISGFLLMFGGIEGAGKKLVQVVLGGAIVFGGTVMVATALGLNSAMI
jgi:type IV secretion system protein VirB2